MNTNEEKKYQTEEEILREWKSWAEEWLRDIDPDFVPTTEEVKVLSKLEKD